MTLYFEDLTPGREFDLGSVVIDEAEMVAFAERFDPQWYHVDRERATSSSWGGLIASGWLTASLCMRIYVDQVLSQAAADTSPGLSELRWLAAVRAGDTLRGVLTVVAASDSSRGADLGTAELRWEMIRDEPVPGQVVLRMQGRGWFYRRPPSEPPSEDATSGESDNVR